MKVTRNEGIFAFINLIIVGLFFRWAHYYSDQAGDRSGGALLTGMLLAIASLWLTAWLLLRRENDRAHKINLRLVYHAIPVAVASIGWGVAYVLSDYVQPIDLAWIGVVGGGSLIIHWALTRNRAKGINSKKAFL